MHAEGETRPLHAYVYLPASGESGAGREWCRLGEDARNALNAAVATGIRGGAAGGSVPVRVASPPVRQDETDRSSGGLRFGGEPTGQVNPHISP